MHLEILSPPPPGTVIQQCNGTASVKLSVVCHAGELGTPISATVLCARRVLAGFRRIRVGVSASGRVEIAIPGIPAGGPYRIELRCGKAVTHLRDVLVGDVWILAGGRNVASLGQNGSGSPEAGAPVIVRRWMGSMPRTDVRPHVRQQTGLGMRLAEFMLQLRGYPQAIHVMGGFDVVGEDAGTRLEQLCQSCGNAGGLVWYQGEDDAVRCLSAGYQERLQALIGRTRGTKALTAWPVIIVQIGRAVGLDRDATRSWRSIQEQQAALAYTLPGCGLAATADLDLAEPMRIHPDDYAVLARRLGLGLHALAQDSRAITAPIPIAAQRLPVAPGEGCRIAVRFAGAEGGLRSVGPVRGFMVRTAQGDVLDIVLHVSLHGSTAILSLIEHDLPGASVQYGNGANPWCTLHDAVGRGVAISAPVRIGDPSTCRRERRTAGDGKRDPRVGKETTGRWRRTPDGVLPISAIS